VNNLIVTKEKSISQYSNKPIRYDLQHNIEVIKTKKSTIGIFQYLEVFFPKGKQILRIQQGLRIRNHTLRPDSFLLIEHTLFDSDWIIYLYLGDTKLYDLKEAIETTKKCREFLSKSISKEVIKHESIFIL